MENPLFPDGHTRAGTLGGTLLVVVLHIGGAELLKTAVLAAVSFAVSLVLKWVVQRWRGRGR